MTTYSRPLQFDYRDGSIIALWRGERIGSFQHRGDCCVSGCAIFGDSAFDCDDFSEDGMPLEWVERKLDQMCQRVERERAAA